MCLVVSSPGRIGPARNLHQASRGGMHPGTAPKAAFVQPPGYHHSYQETTMMQAEGIAGSTPAAVPLELRGRSARWRPSCVVRSDRPGGHPLRHLHPCPIQPAQPSTCGCPSPADACWPVNRFLCFLPDGAGLCLWSGLLRRGGAYRLAPAERSDRPPRITLSGPIWPD